MLDQKVKDNIIVGVQVAGVAAGVLAGIAVVGGLNGLVPAEVNGFKKAVIKVGIGAAGIGVDYAANKAVNEAGINVVAAIDVIGDKIIENRKNKPVKEKKVRVKNRNIKEARAFGKAKKIANK